MSDSTDVAMDYG